VSGHSAAARKAIGASSAAHFREGPTGPAGRLCRRTHYAGVDERDVVRQAGGAGDATPIVRQLFASQLHEAIEAISRQLYVSRVVISNAVCQRRVLRGTERKPRPRVDGIELKPGPNPSRLDQFDGQTSVAVVNVTTNGRVIWPLKRSWMNVSTSSNSPLRSPGFIIWVPEYDNINLR
jgi:hypothetical protein